jgi:hypothetical protein
MRHTTVKHGLDRMPIAEASLETSSGFFKPIEGSPNHFDKDYSSTSSSAL